MCPDIADPFNGQITFSSDRIAPFEFGTTATYSCDNGYMLTGGDTVRTCAGDGSSDIGAWSGAAPTCQCKEMKY